MVLIFQSRDEFDCGSRHRPRPDAARALERIAGRIDAEDVLELHPADAETCVSLGVDGLIVSNHGGRQIEALPAAIDVLPAIARAVGGRSTVMLVVLFEAILLSVRVER